MEFLFDVSKPSRQEASSNGQRVPFELSCSFSFAGIFFSDFNGSRAAAPAGKKSCRKLELKENPLKELREL